MSSKRFIPPGIWKSDDGHGNPIYVIPGPPDMGLGKFRNVRDLVCDVRAFMARTPGDLAVNSADSTFLLKDNAKKNRRGGMHDWRKLWGRESEKICVLVSCGPSLTQSLGEIRELTQDKEKYFTLGINRAFRAVDLDYYVVIDRRGQGDWVQRDTHDTKLIAGTTAAHHIVEKFEDRYFGETFLGGTDEGNAPLRTGMCVTLADAMMAAYKLGAEEIWLYGCDFALEGQEHESGYMLSKYYFDLPGYVGLGIRPEELRTMQPVPGIGGQVCFINYELWAYACYTTAMACMLEESGGVPVKNKSKSGIMYWGRDED